jgi:hypothetical protein
MLLGNVSRARLCFGIEISSCHRASEDPRYQNYIYKKEASCEDFFEFSKETKTFTQCEIVPSSRTSDYDCYLGNVTNKCIYEPDYVKMSLEHLLKQHQKLHEYRQKALERYQKTNLSGK